MPPSPAMPRPRSTRRSLPLLLFGAVLLWAGAAGAAVLNGKVERVIDGDSLIFVPDGGGKPLEVRLYGIDAPEGCQDGGDESRDYLRRFVGDKPVKLTTRGKDTYGRTLGEMVVDDLVVNERMVAEGHAWSLRTKWNRGPYVPQEKVAVALKRGLFASLNPLPPWEFRKRNGRCGGAASGASAPQSAKPS